MKKFEYKVLNLTAKDLSDEAFLRELNNAFNKWGSEGWDLIKMESIEKGSYMTMGSKTSAFVLVFKRELPDNQHLAPNSGVATV